jgi:hypothetical protein
MRYNNIMVLQHDVPKELSVDFSVPQNGKVVNDSVLASASKPPVVGSKTRIAESDIRGYGLFRVRN